MTTVFSTDEVSPKKFRPHGRIEFELIDPVAHIIHIRCFGPFNKEVMDAVEQVQTDMTLLHPQRKELIQFVDSALAVPEFIAAVANYLQKHKHNGVCPAAVALVIAPGVEGKTLMQDSYTAVYQRAQINMALFDDADSALDWLRTLPSVC